MPGLDTTDRIYVIDGSHLVRQRRLSYAVIATALVAVWVTALVTGFPLVIVVLVSLLAAVVPACTSAYLVRQAGTARLRLDRHKLSRDGASDVQSIPWRAVTRIRVQVRPTGEASAIEVHAIGSRPMTLSGYESMAELVADLHDRVPASAAVVLTPHRLVFDRPLRVAIILTACAVAPVLLGALVEPARIVEMSRVAQVAVAAWFVAHGPVSRVAPKLRWLEFAMALGMMLPLVGLLRW